MVRHFFFFIWIENEYVWESGMFLFLNKIQRLIKVIPV